MPKVVASIEARMQSSRLPGKVLMDINGVPALTRIVRRLRMSKGLDDIVVATTTEAADDAIVAWAVGEGVACHRGSEADVLQRVVDAHQKMKSDIIVEVTGDSVLLDPIVIDHGITAFFATPCDVVTNVRPQTWPAGVDVQVFRAVDLAHVARTVVDPAVREHVSLYFYEHPELYRILRLTAPSQWHAPHLRFQLDYPEDLQFIRQVYQRLEPLYGDAFGMAEIMNLLQREPTLTEINAHCEEKAAR